MGVSNIFNGDCVLDDDKQSSQPAGDVTAPPASLAKKPFGHALWQMPGKYYACLQDDNEI